MIELKNPALRKALQILIPFVFIPGAIVIGIFVFKEKRYALIILAVALLSLLLFCAGFEKKKIGTRRLILVSVMAALSVVGRFIPLFKPVTALTIITAIHLGSEAGFMTGSMSALLSNFYFGQGPWTPFQMFVWGMIGLTAGFLAKPLKEHKWLLLLFGLFAGVFYSFVMDLWTVLSYTDTWELESYLTALYTAIPYTVVYCVSNVIFLLAFAGPIGVKLERVRLVYGV